MPRGAAGLYVTGHMVWVHSSACSMLRGGWSGTVVDRIGIVVARTIVDSWSSSLISAPSAMGDAGTKGARIVRSLDISGIGGDIRTYIVCCDGSCSADFKWSGRTAAFAKRRRWLSVRLRSRGKAASRTLSMGLMLVWSDIFIQGRKRKYLITCDADFRFTLATYASAKDQTLVSSSRGCDQLGRAPN
jgi:hypothetical protein